VILDWPINREAFLDLIEDRDTVKKTFFVGTALRVLQVNAAAAAPPVQAAKLSLQFLPKQRPLAGPNRSCGRSHLSRGGARADRASE